MRTLDGATSFELALVGVLSELWPVIAVLAGAAVIRMIWTLADWKRPR
jgi:hypothetical protein